MIAQRERFLPSRPGRCIWARRTISITHTVVLPEPNGPIRPRKNESSSMNARATGPGGA